MFLKPYRFAKRIWKGQCCRSLVRVALRPLCTWTNPIHPPSRKAWSGGDLVGLVGKGGVTQMFSKKPCHLPVCDMETHFLLRYFWRCQIKKEKVREKFEMTIQFESGPIQLISRFLVYFQNLSKHFAELEGCSLGPRLWRWRGPH